MKALGCCGQPATSQSLWPLRILFRCAVPAAGLAAMALLFGLSCTRYYSLRLTPQGQEENAFPKIVRRATLALEGRAGSFSLRVRYAPGEIGFARRALEDVERPARFLRQMTGREAQGSATFYLYPVPTGEAPPVYAASGWGTGFVEVFLVREGKELLEVPRNRNWFYLSYVHELAHAYLHGLGLRERWLSDGLAEYLAAEFARMEVPDLYRGLHWSTPPVVALERTSLEAWDLSDLDAIERAVGKDPALAHYLAEKAVWRYAAADELMRRWMRAARKHGVEAPVEDLLRRIERLDRKVDFETVQELASAQTGRSLEEIAAVTESELAEVREAAWASRGSPEPAARVRALTTLSHLGLPPGADAEDLLPTLELPPESEKPERWRRSLVEAAGGALATAHAPDLAMRSLAAIDRRLGQDAVAFLPARFWLVVAERDHEQALERLLAIMASTEESLSRKEAADRALREVTGESVGWRVGLRPGERQEKAGAWEAIVGSGISLSP